MGYRVKKKQWYKYPWQNVKENSTVEKRQTSEKGRRMIHIS